MTKFNNYLLMFLGAFTPFFTTFDNFYIKFLAFEFLYLILVAYYFVYLVVTSTMPEIKSISKITLFFILFFVAQGISALFASDIGLSFARLNTEFHFLIIFLVINNLFINEKSHEFVFRGLLIGFLLSCFIALMQYLGYKSFSIFSSDQLNANVSQVVNKQKETRIWGPFGNSLTFSEYLSVTGVLLYAYFKTIKRTSVIGFIMVAFAFGCIILTLGRTAIFALGFSLLIIEFIFAKRNYSKGVVVAVIACAVILLAFLLLSPGIQENGNPFLTRFGTASQDLKEGRLNLWVKGFQAFSKDPLFGVGPGNLHSALSAEGFPMTSKVIRMYDSEHVENYYLTILYTLGVTGFFFLVMIYFYLIKYSYALFKFLNRKAKTYAYGGVMMGPLIALMINNITNPALIGDERIRMLFILIAVVINNSYLQYDSLNTFKKGSILGKLFSGKLVIKTQ